MSKIYKTDQVFGVSKNPVASYIERDKVDGMLINAVESDKQIIVYGSSKQGKTALVEKHLPYKDNILVSLTPKFRLIDIYRTILSTLGIELATEKSTTTGISNEVNFGAKVKAKFPFLGEAEATAGAKKNSNEATTEKTTYLELNLELPNDVYRAIQHLGVKKFVILENFHYHPTVRPRPLGRGI